MYTTYRSFCKDAGRFLLYVYSGHVQVQNIQITATKYGFKRVMINCHNVNEIFRNRRQTIFLRLVLLDSIPVFFRDPSVEGQDTPATAGSFFWKLCRNAAAIFNPFYQQIQLLVASVQSPCSRTWNIYEISHIGVCSSLRMKKSPSN